MTSGRTEARSRASLLVDGALLLVVLSWASTFTTFKVAWRDMDPVAFTGLRFAAMFVFSLGVLALGRQRIRPRRADLPALALSGMTGFFLYQMGFVLGLDRTSAVASAILISTHPIFSVVFLWLARRERPHRRELLGVIVGFVGVAVFLRAWDAFGTARIGDLFSLGAAAAFGAYGVVNAPLTKRYPPTALIAYGLALGGVLIAVVATPAMVRQDWAAVRWPAWLILAYAIVVPVYLAYFLWNWAIHRRGVPRTVVYGFMVPILGGAMAVIALHERLHPEQVVGAVVVIAALVVTRLARPASRQVAASSEPGGGLGGSEARSRVEAD
jgi:drug/metabolite transporter (DMT)-like permease